MMVAGGLRAACDGLLLTTIDSQSPRHGGRADVSCDGELEGKPEAGHLRMRSTASRAEAIEMLDREPDVVLMDIWLPDRDGADVTTDLLARRPDIRVLVLTMFHDDTVIERALNAGASGYLVKDAPPTEILHAIEAVAGGAMVIGSALASRIRNDLVRRPTGRLTLCGSLSRAPERERQVLGLIADGLDNRAIAERLGVSMKTVANYVSAILTRLQVQDRASAVQLMRNRTMNQ